MFDVKVTKHSMSVGDSNSLIVYIPDGEGWDEWTKERDSWYHQPGHSSKPFPEVTALNDTIRLTPPVILKGVMEGILDLVWECATRIAPWGDVV